MRLLWPADRADGDVARMTRAGATIIPVASYHGNVICNICYIWHLFVAVVIAASRTD